MQTRLFIVLVIHVFVINLAFSQALGPQSAANYTIGLHADGTVYTWGYNEFGQLGDNTTNHSSTPVKVLKGAYSGTTYLGDDSNNKIIAVALGSFHSIALAADGTVYTWGRNEEGQLGDNTATDRSMPVKVLKGAYSGTTYLGDDSNNKIIAVALGEYHSIALAADGTVYTWGRNNSGQLGDNTATDRSTPVKVLKGAYSGTTYLGDDSNNKIIAVAPDAEHSIALAADGTVYTWGYNGHGQLGDNTTNISLTPVKVLKGAYSGTTYLGDDSNNKIIAVALGYRYSIALAEEGTVYTWGRNEEGQLGDNTATDRSTPVKVLKGAYSGTTYLGDDSNNKIIAVALGFEHSIALAADGTVYTWGDNEQGQLGDNTETDRSTPVKVLKGAYPSTTYLGDDSNNKIIAVALGSSHSIALAADGTVYTWGYNYFGQLGDNTTTHHRLTPIKVHGVGNVDYLILEVDVTAPSIPQNLTAIPGNGQVTLKWDENSESDIVKYIIYGGTSTSPTTKVDSTTSASDTMKTITGLTNGMTYYYRVTAVDNAGNESGFSSEVSATPTQFPEAGSTPTATTNVATNVSTTSATLNGTVNPNNLSTEVWFEYGTTTSYGITVTADQSPVTGTDDVSVSANLTGLSENTTYHYRVVATNSVGTANGSDQTFSTLSEPQDRFQVDASISIADPLGVRGIVAGDIKNDGTARIIVSSWSTGDIYVYGYTGASYVEEWTDNIDISGYIGSLVPIAVGDVDHDFQNEFLVASYDSVYMYQWNGTTYDRAVQQVLSGLYKPGVILDLDRDGFNEVVLVYSNSIGVFEFQAASKSLELIWSTDELGSLNSIQVAVGDVDHDGYQEVCWFSADADVGKIVVIGYNGATYGIETEITGFSKGLGGGAIADYNGDGKQEIITSLGNVDAASYPIYLVEYDGSAYQVQTLHDATMGMFQIHAGDVDGDGLPEANILRNYSNSFIVEFESSVYVVSEANHSGACIFGDIADVDGDGLGELIVGALQSQILSDIYGSADAVAPAVPTDLTATPGPGRVTLSWSPNTDPDLSHYVVYQSTMAGFTPVSSDSVGPVSKYNAAAVLTDLTNDITYYYRIKAVDAAGNTSGFSNEGSATPYSIPATATTDAATNIGTISATLNGTVNPNDLSTTVDFDWGETTTYTHQIAAEQSPVNGTSDVAVSANLTGLSENTTYHYRVVAVNSAGTTNGSDQSFTTSFSYPSTFTIDISINFPLHANASDYEATNYRIVGLPGESDFSMSNVLLGNHIDDWQMFWDNGAATDYLVEYDGSSDFKFNVGRAFWLIHKGFLSLNTTTNSAPLNESQAVEVPLHTGWNLITNPFTSSISWSTIQNINGISGPIYSYSGSYSTPSNFSPYKGYYYFNEQNLSSLSIPYFSGNLARNLPLDINDDEGWEINISMSTGDVLEQTTWFGIATDAGRGKDSFDYRKPRAVGPIPGVYFNRLEWDPDYSIFATDIRPNFTESETWGFSVCSPLLKSVELLFKNIDEIPLEFEIYLIDKERLSHANLRENPRYSFAPVTKESNFTIIVGKENIIKERLASMFPKEFALRNNYPNPFNPVTTLRYDLPERSEVSLTIYDILGRQVRTLVNSVEEPGYKSVIWDGTDDFGRPVGTGVYLYQIQAGDFTQTRKMVLLK